MKVTQDTPPFIPVVITIENREELESLLETIRTGVGSQGLFYRLKAIHDGDDES